MSPSMLLPRSELLRRNRQEFSILAKTGSSRGPIISSSSYSRHQGFSQTLECSASCRPGQRGGRTERADEVIGRKDVMCPVGTERQNAMSAHMSASLTPSRPRAESATYDHF